MTKNSDFNAMINFKLQQQKMNKMTIITKIIKCSLFWLQFSGLNTKYVFLENGG